MKTSPHLNPVTVRLCLGDLPWREREAVLHLLTCEDCRDELLLELEHGDPLADATHEGSTAYTRSLDLALDRAEQRILERLPAVERERLSARALLDELWMTPIEQWEAFFDRPLPASFLNLVLDRAAPLVGSDLNTGLILERLVRAAVERLKTADLPPLLHQELVARAWIFTGQLRTRGGLFRDADAAFEEAGRALAAAPTSPAVEAELCRCVADLYEHQGRPVEAAALIAQAARLAGEAQELLAEIADIDRQARLFEERGLVDHAAGLWAAALLRAEEAGLQMSEAYVRLRLLWALRTLGYDREALALTPDALIVKAAVTPTAQLGAAFHSACRGEVETAISLFSGVLDHALAERDALMTALAALNLLQLFIRESGQERMLSLAPIFDLLSSASEFDLSTRNAFAALGPALRERTGSIESLLLAAAAALDRQEARHFLH